MAYAGAAPAATTKKPAAPKVKVAKLQIDVAGFFEARELHDTTSDCFPGERWIKTNSYSFETGRFVDINVRNISLPGTGQSVVTSSLSRSGGSARTKGSISDYDSTNHCDRPAEKLEGPPTCSASRGKTSVALTPGEIPGSDDELAPLKGRPLLLSVRRSGGGTDPLRCAGQVVGLSGVDTELAAITTSVAPGVAAVLPANLDAVKVFAIRRNQRIRRVVTVQGPCSKAAVRVSRPPGPTPSPGPLNADGDCRIFGKVVITIRSRR
ncbi:MAG: hypothetical protein H0V81_16015 [Solirubrobacterales bacterium]|nr:hypothetical protein [Solirubrobacterales bacterium]